MNNERGIYRGIFSALYDEQDYQRLPPHARLTLLTCRGCAQAGPAAIFRYYPELLMVQTGLRAAQLESAFVELEQGNWIYREGVVLWVRNGLRYDPYTTLKNENHAKSVCNWLKGLPKVALVLKFCDYYKLPYPSGWDADGIRDGIGIKDKGFPIPDSPFPIPDKHSPRETRLAIVTETGFDRFYRRYPKRKKPEDARKAWRQMACEPIADEVIAGLERNLADLVSGGTKFIPYPGTWLRARQWQDEPTPQIDERTMHNLQATAAFVEDAERRKGLRV